MGAFLPWACLHGVGGYLQIVGDGAGRGVDGHLSCYGEDGGLLAWDTLLWFFFPAEKDDFLCKVFLFHKGVQMTLDVSGVILESGGVL